MKLKLIHWLPVISQINSSLHWVTYWGQKKIWFFSPNFCENVLENLELMLLRLKYHDHVLTEPIKVLMVQLHVFTTRDYLPRCNIFDDNLETKSKEKIWFFSSIVWFWQKCNFRNLRTASDWPEWFCRYPPIGRYMYWILKGSKWPEWPILMGANSTIG